MGCLIAAYNLFFFNTMLPPAFSTRSVVKQHWLYPVERIGKLRLWRFPFFKFFPKGAVFLLLILRQHPINPVCGTFFPKALGFSPLYIISIGVPCINFHHIV